MNWMCLKTILMVLCSKISHECILLKISTQKTSVYNRNRKRPCTSVDLRPRTRCQGGPTSWVRKVNKDADGNMFEFAFEETNVTVG